MTKQYFTVLALILAAFAVLGTPMARAEGETLSASITAADIVNQNEDITFLVEPAGGTGVYVYTWDFGDGTQSSGQSPSHAYDTVGSKTVTVVVTDTDNNQVSANKTITVNALALSLTADIASPANGAAFDQNEDITFLVEPAGGTGVYVYTWDFGDGTQSSGQSPSHAYDTVGSKTVTVVVTDTDNNQVSDSINLTIETGGVVTPAPVLTFTANGQTGSLTVSTTTAVTLAWTATDATSCSASDAWSGTKSLSGSETVGPFATPSSSRTYTLTCVGAGGTTARNVVVSTAGDSGVDLVITNVRVTDVNNNSAIVRWETNLPADSRVIYDTVSHSSISGAAAPNYGYQFSTGTDSALVTSHAVTVSGLSSGTHYYFRVISEN